MKIGIFSDIHGNLPALKNVLQHLNKLKVDDCYFLGDAVGYFSQGSEVIELLKSKGIKCLKGNHEAMYLGEATLDPQKDHIYRIRETTRSFTEETRDSVAKWPEKFELSLKNDRILMVHGSPFDHVHGYVYPDTEIKAFEKLPYNFIFTAHTHRPFIKHMGEQTVVNVGSVGLPRDAGTLSSFCVFDVVHGRVEIFRLPFSKDQLLDLVDFTPDASVISCLNRVEENVVGTIIK